MHFKQREVAFGLMRKGEKRQHTYEFTNVGDTDLIISIVSACDCTTTDYPTKPIKPGGKGKIDIVFDSADKDEAETIDVDIILENVIPDNEDPIIERLQYTFDIKK